MNDSSMMVVVVIDKARKGGVKNLRIDNEGMMKWNGKEAQHESEK